MTRGGQGHADDALAAVTMPVAQRAQRISSTALTPEVVDLVVDLSSLRGSGEAGGGSVIEAHEGRPT